MAAVTETIDTVDVIAGDASPPDASTSAMEVFLFRSHQPGRKPGLVLAQHIPVGHTGIENDTFTCRAAERFAAAGFVVAVPFLFHWWPKDAPIERKREEARDDEMVADMRAAFARLAAEDDVDQARIGVVGHCWGGRVAWLAACHIPELTACAIFYGGRIKLPMGPGSVAPIELAGDIRCPVIGFFGNDDRNPTPADVDDYAAALAAAGVPHTFHRYDGAGHAFQNFPTPERYREAASEDAWRKALDFLTATLQGPRPMRQDELDRAYRGAIYRLLLSDGPLDLCIDAYSEPLSVLLAARGVRTAAFLTACNPGSEQDDPAINQAAQAALQDAASRLGRVTLPGVAVDPHGQWPDEESVLVLGIDAAEATMLARRFGQNALVWINAGATPELVWVDQPANG